MYNKCSNHINRKRELTDIFLNRTPLIKILYIHVAPTLYGQVNETNANKMYIKSSGNHMHDIGSDIIPLFPFWVATPEVNFCEKSLTGIHEINVDIR